MTRYEYPSALLIQLIGSAAALLIAARTWQTVTTPRPAPLQVDVLAVSGRTVDAAPTALALVALAGVVAVVATRGVVRRGVGALVAAAGAVMVWRAVASAPALGTARARALVTDRHRTVDAGAVVPHVAVHGVWPALTVVCGLLVCASGVIVVLRGQRWRALSARYERPSRVTAEPETPTAPAMWTALDRGDDPTSDPATDPTGAAQGRLDTLDSEHTGSDSTGGRCGGERSGRDLGGRA